MSTINLIPTYLKKEQAVNQISSLVFVSLFTFLLMGLIVFGALYATNYFAEQELAEKKLALSEQELKNQSLKEISDDILLINGKLKKISSIKDAKVDWNKFLVQVNSSVPAKVQLSSLQADRKAKKFTITGKAESRREIVKLQKKLETLEYFKNLVFNSSSLNPQDNDYSFSIAGDFIK